MAGFFDIFRWLLGLGDVATGGATDTDPISSCDRIAVDQQQGGSQYPFIDPDETTQSLILDFYLAYEDDTSQFSLPFSIDWMYGFGTFANDAVDGAPFPANAQDLRVIDANGLTVFDSTTATRFAKKDWGSDKVIIEWTSPDAVCRVVWCGINNDLPTPSSSSDSSSSSGSSSSSSSSDSSSSVSVGEGANCHFCIDPVPDVLLVNFDGVLPDGSCNPDATINTPTFVLEQHAIFSCTYEGTFTDCAGRTLYITGEFFLDVLLIKVFERAAPLGLVQEAVAFELAYPSNNNCIYQGAAALVLLGGPNTSFFDWSAATCTLE